MKISYDPEADVMYIHLVEAEPEPHGSAYVAGDIGLVAEQDRDGRVIGLEIQGARRRLGEGVHKVELDILTTDPARV